MKTATIFRASSLILALAALITPSCITAEGLGQRGVAQLINGVNPSSIGAAGVGQMLDQHGQTWIDHHHGIQDAINNMDNFTPAPVIYPSPSPEPYFTPAPTYSFPPTPFTTGSSDCSGVTTCPNLMTY